MQIELKNVNKSFDNFKALKNINLSLKSGTKAAILGSNGAGKSTLIRAIMGFFRLDSGCILINEQDLSKNRLACIEKIAFFPQSPPALNLSVKEFINFSFKVQQMDKELFALCLDSFDFSLQEHEKKSFKLLSNGLKAKLLNSLALAKKSDILILDEPYASLDTASRLAFYELIKRQDKAKIMLFISHRASEIKELINTKIYMELGSIIQGEENV